MANPVDILTSVAIKLSGYAPNRVFGSGTVLDTARLKYNLGQHLDVDSRSVHAFIIGEHGDSEIAAWSCKKATYYGIAMSVKRICEAIVRNEKSILPISSLMNGEYGISGVALSMPAIVNRQGVETHVPLQLNEEEVAALKKSADTLKKILEENEISARLFQKRRVFLNKFFRHKHTSKPNINLNAINYAFPPVK